MVERRAEDFSSALLIFLDKIIKECYNILVVKQKILEKIKEKGIRKTTLRHYNTNVTIWKGPQQSDQFMIFEEDKMEMLLDLLLSKKEYMNVTEKSVMGGKRLLLWNIGDLWYRITNPKLAKLFKEELMPNFTEVHMIL